MTQIPLDHALWLDVADPDELPDDLAVEPVLRESFRHREKYSKLRVAGGQVLFVLRRLLWRDGELVSQQCTFCCGAGILLTLHEAAIPAIERVREEVAAGKVLAAPAAVVWRIADLLVAEYLTLLDSLEGSVLRMESQTLFDARPQVLEELLSMKRHLTLLRNHIAGAREVMNLLSRLDLPGLDANLRPYFLDVYDHLILAQETADMYRELLASSVAAHLSVISNRLNEVMKTLTIIATIMMPLTVITGFYGMNFHMPETDWAFGYPFVLGLMAAVTGAMLLYFRRRRWL